jgi:predicted nucleotidyltransferase
MDELRAMGVVSLELFGSVARDEATQRSDVDLLVDIDPEEHIGLFGFVRIQQRIEEILGVPKVDLTMRDCVHEELRDDIFREAIRVA